MSHSPKIIEVKKIAKRNPMGMQLLTEATRGNKKEKLRQKAEPISFKSQSHQKV